MDRRRQQHVLLVAAGGRDLRLRGQRVVAAEGRREGDVVPVRLQAQVTEVGTLLVEAVPTTPQKPDERWKIELSVRENV